MIPAWFSRTIAFPYILNAPWRPDKNRRGFTRLLQEKIATQYWPPEQLAAWQLDRLRPLLTHAGRHVPYYRDLFRANDFDPRGLRALSDLSALPPLTRPIIQSQGRRLLADDTDERQLTTGQTSGTTGPPLDFWRDRNYDRHLEAAAWLSDLAAGRRLGSSTAYLWGWTPLPRALDRLMGRLRDLLRNEQRYNTRFMPPAALQRFHRALQARPPDILVAYPSGAALLARHLERHGLQPRYPRIALIPTGETLRPETRALLERAFPAPFFNRYGSRELGLMAFECSSHSGLHVNGANVIVECEGNDVYREPGELIVTQLHNYAMPLIRYQLDDQAVLDASPAPCPCGRTSPRLARLAGRHMPPILTPAGTPVEPYFLIRRVREMSNVIEFQLTQEDQQHLRLRIVPGPNCVPEQFTEARAAIESLMGPACELTIDFVPAIPRPPSGKLQMVISELSQ